MDSERRIVVGPKSGKDAEGLEYSHLLISQLESQRLWYESKMAELEQTLMQQVSIPKEPEKTVVDFREVERVRGELTMVVKEKRALERRLDRVSEGLDTLTAKYQEEREINEALRRNQESWKAEVAAKEKLLAEKEKEVNELNEQVRDLMFYLETQQKVDQSPMKDELQGGTIVVEERQNASPSVGAKKKPRGKR
ncbi:hypothetical protein BC829DRAFT_409445 [Chytridium lagenaria]|nr:hypothetical protein BC829DRAFT_409445 [Chytridium lagenaria]